jgi:hypothetical protein
MPVFNVKTGNVELQAAVQVIHCASGLTNQMSNCAMGADIGEISAAIKPIIVIGATTGAANIFARMLMGLMYPESATMTGEQSAIAAIGGANIFGRIFGAISSNPAVARTESAKPGSRD